MTRIVHYGPSQRALFCYEEASTTHDEHMAASIAGRKTTDIRRVNCPVCLHAVAASLVRKGVPVKLTAEGEAFCKQHLKKRGEA